MTISVRHVSKSFGSHKVLDRLSLEIEPGRLLSLLGPSGCGKTTLLRIIAGLEQADRGHVFFHGADTTGWDFRQRKVGFVFQNYALFRHMTVAENISSGMRMRPRAERPGLRAQAKRVDDLLRLVQLESYAGRLPHQLSGGQRQRVALARALAIDPQILLLDEPFGALDAKVRKDLRAWLRELQQELGITTILVTHDQEEAMEISDHIILLNQGRIEQQGSPEEPFENPTSAFALMFLGQAQALRGRTGGGDFFVRPHEIELSKEPGGERSAEIRRISLRGPVARLQIEAFPGGPSPLLTVELSRDRYEAMALRVGESVAWRAKRLHAYPDAGSTH